MNISLTGRRANAKLSHLTTNKQQQNWQFYLHSSITLIMDKLIKTMELRFDRRYHHTMFDQSYLSRVKLKETANMNTFANAENALIIFHKTLATVF